MQTDKQQTCAALKCIIIIIIIIIKCRADERVYATLSGNSLARRVSESMRAFGATLELQKPSLVSFDQFLGSNKGQNNNGVERALERFSICAIHFALGAN